MSAHLTILVLLALALTSCGMSADNAEHVFREHTESFERARVLAIEQAEASGKYGLRISGSPRAGASDPASELNRLLAETGIEAVQAERDSASGWHVAFTLEESGLATSGRILSIANGTEPHGPYNESSEVRPLGDGWYVSESVG